MISRNTLLAFQQCQDCNQRQRCHFFYSDLTFVVAVCAVEKERKEEISTSGPRPRHRRQEFLQLTLSVSFVLGQFSEKVKPHAAVALRQGRLSHSYWNSVAVCRSRDSEPPRFLNGGRCLFPRMNSPGEAVEEDKSERRSDVESSAAS